VQVKRFRPDLRVETLRGNVDTRIRKLQEGHYDAIILAYAGVRRLGLEGKVSQVLDWFIPAVGQGSLAIEMRKGDQKVAQALEFLNHRESSLRATAERAFLGELGGGCQVPVGAYAWIESEKLKLRAFISDLRAERFLEGYMEGPPEKAEQIGKALAQKLLTEGGRSILREIYGES
ncbi:MAG: hydroxymethylbilane synthase, partial [Aquificaceae bacterium]|nr:hydroxymethylbilane synthase [Aquificaceae bacterium]